MVFSKYDGVKISAIAASVPPTVIDVTSELDNPDPKYIKNFMKNTGILEKRKSDFTQTAADFSYTAAKQIMDSGYYKPEEIGVLINLTQTPDYRTPSTALTIQKRLGLSMDCLVFDVNLGCSGFVYGVSLAASILNSSNATKALVTVGDSLARGRRHRKKVMSSNTGLLFGDASAAILLEKSGEGGFSSALMSDGTRHKALSIPYGAWRHPEGPQSVPGDDIAVFNFTISEVPKLLEEYLAQTDTKIEDYDNLVLHQANMMILKNIAKRVGMPMENVPVCLDRYGNTSGCSVPLAIVDRYGTVEEDREVNLLTSSFGVGLSWGVVGFKINVKDILPITDGYDIYEDGYSDEYDDEGELKKTE
ncbi:MAG: ketoacyl-ACP synthase III [Lachnospiraceae bacterium]|nr:ketoacyl-ACP synthase III [Lachnospiraceae bacterium]